MAVLSPLLESLRFIFYSITAGPWSRRQQKCHTSDVGHTKNQKPVVMRVPYPLGFYSRGLDGRIDDPNGGWKGRGVWATFGTGAPWHIEGGKGKTSEIVRFQIRPNPLAN